MLAIKRADAQDIADHKAEGHNDCGDGERADGADNEVRAVRIQPFAHEGHHGKQDEVEEIDVQRARADVLQAAADERLLRERLLVVAEEHQHHHHRGIHRQRARQVRPHPPERVPAQDVGAAYEGHHAQDGEEPAAVEHALHAVPIAVGQVAAEEELEIDDQLDEARRLHPFRVGVGEYFRHIGRGVGRDAQQPNAHPYQVLMLQAMKQQGERIIADEHIEQHERKPVASLVGTMYGRQEGINEVCLPNDDEGTQENERGQQLYAHLLPEQLACIGERPTERSLVGHVAADEEEQRHPKEHQQRESRRRLGQFAKRGLADMIGHNHEHRKSAHGVNPFQSFFGECQGWLHTLIYIW